MCGSLLWLHLSVIILKASVTEKQQELPLISYLGFISNEWFLIAWGVDTHMYQLPGQKQLQ